MTLAQDQVDRPPPDAGTVTVTVRVLDHSGKPTTTVADGPITLFHPERRPPPGAAHDHANLGTVHPTPPGRLARARHVSPPGRPTVRFGAPAVFRGRCRAEDGPGATVAGRGRPRRPAAASGSVPLSVLTQSMEPTLPAGTLAVVDPRPEDSDRGRRQVPTRVRPPRGRPHRVVAIRSSSDGTRQLVFRGDAHDVATPSLSARPDPWCPLVQRAVARGRQPGGERVAALAPAAARRTAPAYGVMIVTDGVDGPRRLVALVVATGVDHARRHFQLQAGWPPVV